MNKLPVILAVGSLMLASCGSDDSSASAATDPAPVSDATSAATDPAPVTDATSAVPVTDAAPVTEASGSDTAGFVCGADNFDLSVNDVERTDGYADPELSVTCDDTTMTVTSNNIIAYEFVQITPNDLGEIDVDIDFPIVPTERATAGAMGLGAIGLAINGVELFAAFEAPADGYRDPLSDGLLDFCNGHTAPRGEYHYHARPDCILDDPTAAGTVVGYVVDGYDVLVPWTTTGEQIASSYQKINGDDLGAFTGWEYVAGSGDLDECNGMVGDDGLYHYYATDEFPYLPFCFHGETGFSQGDFTGDEPAGGGGAFGPPDGQGPPPDGQGPPPGDG